MYENIIDSVAELNPYALIPDGFEEAVVGIDYYTRVDPVAQLDSDICVRILAREMSEEDAMEFFEFNVAGSHMGEGTPIFVTVSVPEGVLKVFGTQARE